MARKPLYGRLDFFDGAHLKILNHHVSTDKPSCFQISNPRPEKKVSVPSPLPVTRGRDFSRGTAYPARRGGFFKIDSLS